MSQLLLHLEAQLSASTDPVVRGEISVQRACYLARVGRFDEAEAAILAVRKAYGDGTQARISCWLMLAEGLLEFFRDLSPRAKDRIARAQLISVAIKDPSLAAITSAWKAHIDYESSEFSSMASALRTALQFASEDDHQARARAALVIANCMFLCGDREKAQTWFMKSRTHALAAGDQATIEALLYNRASFGVACLRAERCFAAQEPELIGLVKREIASAFNLQIMLGNQALKHIIIFCEVWILVLNQEYQQALERLRGLQGAAPLQRQYYSDQLINLETVYCLHKLDRHDEALRVFEAIRTTSYDSFDIDDQLVAAWTLHELAEADPRYGDPQELAARVSALRVAYRTSRDLIRHSIETALTPSTSQTQ